MLGIETSCDETAAAVVEETGDPARPWAIRSNVVASQVPIHREWGGVVPELASRQHIRDICGVVERALDEAGIDLERPGRAWRSRRVPAWSARCSSACRSRRPRRGGSGLPLVAVHHLAGHIESLVLQNGELPLPAVVLVVSGGHTSLYLVERPGHYQLLSRTRDDAAGEAYDKVAKLLGLGYPGGPVIDRLARDGNDRAVALPATRLTHADRNAPTLKGDLDFSFSGLKTAVLRHVPTTGDCAVGRGNCRHLCELSAGRRQRRSSIGCSTRRAVTRPGVSASQAACRPTVACARSSRCTATLREIPTFRAEPRAVDRQCGDDRRRRAPEASRRCRCGPRSQCGCVAHALKTQASGSDVRAPARSFSEEVFPVP